VKETSVELISYKGWKQNVRLTNGVIELIVTLDVGPRIIRCGFVGGPNLFGEFKGQLGKRGEKKWMIRGGHRLWVAPEHKPRTYELDNGPVESVCEIPNGIRVVQRPGTLTGIRKSMDITVPPRGARVRIIHTLTNAGQQAVECSAWALSVMAKKGVAIIPMPKLIPHDERCTPNQNWSLWSYTDMTDPRLKLGSKFVLVRQDPRRGPFKLGVAQREGWVSYLQGDTLFVKNFARKAGAVYPDNDVNLEVYTDKNILEIETMSPLVTLKPGQSIQHEERWLITKLGRSRRG
jgi:hypothetical protein